MSNPYEPSSLEPSPGSRSVGRLIVLAWILLVVAAIVVLAIDIGSRGYEDPSAIEWEVEE